MCYMSPSAELLGPTTPSFKTWIPDPRFQTTLMPLFHTVPNLSPDCSIKPPDIVRDTCKFQNMRPDVLIESLHIHPLIVLLYLLHLVHRSNPDELNFLHLKLILLSHNHLENLWKQCICTSWIGGMR